MTAARPGCTLHPGKTQYLLYRRLEGVEVPEEMADGEAVSLSE